MATTHLFSMRTFYEDLFIAVPSDWDFFSTGEKPYVHYKGYRWIPMYELLENILHIPMSYIWCSKGNVRLVYNADDVEGNDRKTISKGTLAELKKYFIISSIGYNKEFDSIEITISDDNYSES